MNQAETVALAAYLANPDAVTWEHNGDTKTLAEWIAVRDDAAIAGALSSAELGATLGRTVVRDSVPATEVKAAIASSGDFATMPESIMSKLQWFITADPFPMSNASMTAGVEAILEPFTSAKAAFNGLRTRLGSIAESLIGRNVSVNEVSDVLNA